MKVPRILAASVFIVLGLYLLADDVYTILRYGFDINDVASIDSQWGPIDRPTGEHPSFTMLPAYVYAFGLWLLGGLFLVPWRKFGTSYHGRICRGAE